MKNGLKNSFLSLGVSALLVGGVAMVSAQQNTTDNTTIEQVHQRNGQRGGQRSGKQNGGQQSGLLGARMVEGSTITATFYDGNPEEGAAVLNTHILNVGVDSERTFAQNTREAMQEAAFVTINTSAQSRTIELPNASADGEEAQEGRSNRQSFRGASVRGLVEGSSLEAIFYDGNPEEGAAVLNTLTFTAGTDSELSFRNAFQEAASNAAYVTLNTSPQERTLDLSQLRERFENRGGTRGGPNAAPLSLGDLS